MPIPPEICDEVTTGYHTLVERTQREVPLAVRSSATAEDQAQASFAGQLETYLNIRGLESLLDHIQHCWASLWAERVVSYIARQGLDPLQVSMSVVVQVMIPTEVAGVLFTVNPVSGKREEMVINASWGLGEAIVSGRVSPDTLTARRQDGRVLTRQISDKELQIVYALGGGTEELPVPPEQRTAAALTDAQVGRLVRLGSRIEAHYGRPQDIEWGFYDGQLYLLQSRPITTLALQPVHQYPQGEFNRSMFIEIFPDPLSPIFLSIIVPLFKGMLDFTFRAMGFEPRPDIQAIGGFYNQPYFNRDYIAAAFQPLSPAAREPVIAQMVNPFGEHAEETQLELSLPFVRMLANMLKFMVRFPNQLPGMIARYRQEVGHVECFPYEIATEAEICNEIQRLAFEYAARLLNNDFLMIAVIGRTYHLLGAVLQHDYQAETSEVVSRLISGVTGNVTMQTNQRLWDLAQVARSSPEVSALLRENSPAQAQNLLRSTRAGREFLRALDEFLLEFGHREVRMDILYPTWREDPAPVFGFIRSYLDADESQSPYHQQERLIAERTELTNRVMQDMRRTLRGRLLLAPLVGWILHQTQRHTRERDTMHFEMTRLFPPIRELILELGMRWSDRKLIDQDEDVFFLTIEEMVAMSASPHPAQELVRSRQQAFTYARRHAPPVVIRDGEEIYADTGIALEQGATHMQGIAGSPGKCCGLTRVIQGPEEFGRLQKGEILVAPITNPVWTPLFAIAGAVVTEVGGILSHGAIVAREYGIPAVMSVQGATRLLQDGQRVTVDGDKGVVVLQTEA